MVEIYRLRGEIVLIGVAELNDDISSAKKSAESIFISDIKENQAHLTETELRILSGEVTNFIQFILEKGIKTELAPEENQTLVHWLSLQVMRKLPKGFTDQQEKLKFFLDQLRQEVATLLGSYYENLHSVGDCSMVLRWKEGAKDQPLIGTVEEDATDRSQLLPSQGLSLSEYFFKLDKGTEDQFTFLIQKGGRQALTLAVCFSPQVDIEKYKALLTAESSTVWSQVLNDLPLRVPLIE